MDDINNQQTIISLEDSIDYKRDLHSKALLTTNKARLIEYRARKRLAQEGKNRLDKCVDDINKLKEEVSEIHSMLQLIIHKIT